ncbi:MAG: cupin domain-containing protein [Chthoniobacterales bacterium]
MLPTVTNLLQTPDRPGEEIFSLHTGGRFALERIVSRGEASPPDFWYDQPRDEWVALLRGTATLEFPHAKFLALKSGDALVIPANCRHRVAATSQDAVWLALHFSETPAPNRAAGEGS